MGDGERRDERDRGGHPELERRQRDRQPDERRAQHHLVIGIHR
jgi:hypothetical protein